MEVKQTTWLSSIGSKCRDIKSILWLLFFSFISISSAIVTAKSYVDNKDVSLEKKIDRKFAILHEILKESGPNFKEAVDKVNDKYDNQKQFLGLIRHE